MGNKRILMYKQEEEFVKLHTTKQEIKRMQMYKQRDLEKCSIMKQEIGECKCESKIELKWFAVMKRKIKRIQIREQEQNEELQI